MARQTLSDMLRSFDVPPQLHDRLARVVYNLGGGRPPIVLSTTLLAGSFAAATETIVCTTPPLNPGLDSGNVLVFGTVCIGGVGANGTLMLAQIRRGTTLAGPQIGNNYQQTVVPPAVATGTCIVFDTPGAVAGVQYTLTCQVQNLTGPCNMNNCLIAALAFC